MLIYDITLYSSTFYGLMRKTKPRNIFFTIQEAHLRNGIENLDSQIRDVAHEAEDVIESYMGVQVHSDFADQASQIDLIRVLTDIDSVTMKMLEIVEDCEILTDEYKSISSCVVSLPPRTDTIVGFDQVLVQMLDHLTGIKPSLEIIPIVGMGGIGKTTLARQLYNHGAIGSLFDKRAWVTVSQEFNARAALLTLLSCLVNITDEMSKKNESELGGYLHKILFQRRYLIVIDDIWDNNAWDKVKQFFPENVNRSRILLTTRKLTIAEYAKSSIKPHQLRPINENESWELLSGKVFEKDSCPTELVETGRQIARKCRGLPPAVLLMAGLLTTSKKTLQSWKIVAENVSSAIANYDLHCFEIFSMSYNHLPYYLKPCFLYVGVFPEDYEIPSSKIIKLWIAEGFIKPAGGNNLEHTAEAFLRALIDANLLVVCRTEPNGKVKSFKIHDLLREFCQKKSISEKFFWFKVLDHNIIEDEESIRRVSVHPLFQQHDGGNFMLIARSFLCIGHTSLQLASMFLELRLLRVLDVFQLEFQMFPEAILQLVNLKYLAISCRSDLSSSISRFRNLQTLIIRRLSPRPITLPPELWKMTQLKHIKSKGTCTWYELKTEENVIHEKLQTLSKVHISGANNTLFEKIPNLTKLGIFCEASLDTNINLSCLLKLETLKCSSNLSVEKRSFLSDLTFPDSLKKLTLSKCNIPCGVMTTIGSLPSLEQLKLQENDFLVIPTKSEPEPIGPKWEPADGGFTTLRLLSMEDLNLVLWVADETHFPNLQRLVIQKCCSLEDIPCDIGDINTLQEIKVDDSNPSVLKSAMEIKDQQEALGNTLLQVTLCNAY